MAKGAGSMDEDLTRQESEDPPGLIQPLADLEEAEDYAESRVRELAFLLRTMSAQGAGRGL